VTDGTTVNTDLAVFNSAITDGWGNAGTPIVIDNSSESIGGIAFGGAAGSYTIGSTSGNSLFLTTSGTIGFYNSILTAGPVTETINAPLVIEGPAYTFENSTSNGTRVSSGTLQFGGAISGAGGGATILNLTGNTNANTISGNISNGSAASVSIAEANGPSENWTLSGSNTYTGTTTLTESGTMNITGPLGTMGTPTGAISVGNNTNPSFPTAMNINGSTVYAASLTQNNGGGTADSFTTTLNVTNSTVTLTGVLAVNNGVGDCPGLTAITSGTVNANSVTIQCDNKNFGATLQTSADTADGLYVHGGALNVTTTLGVGLTTNSSANMDVGSGVVTVGGLTTISGSSNGSYELLSVTGGAFTGTGGITLGSANDGANAEDCELLVTGGIVTTSGITFAGNSNTGGGTEELLATGGTLYIGPNGISAGTGTGTFTIALGNSSTGPIVGGTSAWASSMNMTLGSAGATFQAADSDGNAQNITLTGVLSGGGLTKTGAGTLFLGGASSNTYTGVTTISAGDLNVASAGALGNTSSIKFGGGTLQYSSGNSVDYSAKLSNSTTAPIAIDTNGENVTFATTLAASNTGGLAVSDSVGTGSLTIAAASAYTGATTINPGATVKLGDGSASDGTLSGSGIANNGTLIFDPFDSNGSEAVAISGTGTLIKMGTGKESLGAINTFDGTTNVNGGALIVNRQLAGSEPVTVNSGGTLGGSGTIGDDVNVAAGGTLEPGFGLGTAGTTLAVSGMLTLEADSDLTINLNGSVSSVSDEVAVGTKISIDPTDTLTLDVLGLPAGGDTTFTIATYEAAQGETGAFDASNIIVNGGSLVSINYAVTDPNNASLDDIHVTITSTPEPGTWAMFFGGVGLLGVRQWTRRRLRGGVRAV
jgi:autotransporter-associated beta strand protein